MIFGRKRRNREEDVAADADPEVEGIDAADTEDGDPEDGDAPVAKRAILNPDERPSWRGSGEYDEWTAVDEKDWRTDGPFDIDEVDLDDDPVERMDLGALIITPSEAMEVRFQIDQKSAQATAVLLLLRQSAVELSVYATPRKGYFWPEVRQEVLAVTKRQNGSAELAEGPFGVEVRRMVPVSTPEGKNAIQPSRMIMVEGPRWALRAVVYGQSAIVSPGGAVADDAVTTELREVFRDTIVRRGDKPMAPGKLIPLTLPEKLAEEVRQAAQNQAQGQTEPPSPRAGARDLPQPSQNYVARSQG